MKRRPKKKTAARDSSKLVQQAMTALDEGDPSTATARAREALESTPESELAWEVLSIALHRQGHNESAIEAGRKAIALKPDAADFHTNLGVVLRAAIRPREAEASYRAAIACDPAFAPAYHNLGNLARDEGRDADAESQYLAAIERNGSYGDAWHQLGVVLQRQGRSVEAENPLRRAMALMPQRADVKSDLATCLMALNRASEAHELLLNAIENDPNFASSHGNLGALYLRSGRLLDADRETRRAAALAPSEPRWITNHAVIAKDLGRFDEAEGLFRRALALKPDYALAHANLLFCMNYHPSKTAEEIFAEYRRFDEAHARKHLPADLSFENERSPGRRLRVGFLSPDFREHSARHFLWPLLAHYDRERMEVFCYAQVARPDHVTREFQGLAGHWRSTVGHSDDEVAAMIRRDRIDVLMDCGGHTSESRILVMARKPAPVQVAYMLGHGYTSGLSAIDAFLADAALVPQGSEHLFSEKVVRLPRFPVAYTPPREMPDVGPLPALTKGHLTFGYFGRPERINDRVVEAWAEILRGVPRSRLMLNSKAFSEPAFATLTAERFACHGIGRERLEIVYTSPQPKTWAAYGDIDIALDPFPHNAGTTTIEALWLGIPVVSLADRPSVGRFGASILREAGLSDWVANSVENYVSCAAAKAGDLEALARLRASLRARMEASPLCDGRGLVREMEVAFRTLWSTWCAAAANGAKNAARGARQDASEQAKRLDRQGRLSEAASLLREHVARDPADSDGLTHLSDIERRLGRLSNAEKGARNALRVTPGAPAAANALGNALAAQGRLTEAEAAFSAAIEVRPDHAEALNNRALARSRGGQFTAAERDLRKALDVRPDLVDIGFNLANALQEQGRVVEAIETFRATLAKAPPNPRGDGMMLFCLAYHPGLTGEEIFAEFRRWNETHAARHAPLNPYWPNARTGHRRLRVGYVSPDFGNKSSRHFIAPMLSGHDRNKVEVFCYAEVPAPDSETLRLKALTDHWRTTVGLSDDDLASLIRRDQIDVLVDLGGHTARNRLLAQARKPAPVQIAHFLGHGYTSGLSVMDAFLADEELVPVGAEHLFSEPVVRLPRFPVAYTPPQDMPAVSSLPALKRGYVTFGHFGRVVRLNEQVVSVWASILRAVPESRLVLNTVAFLDKDVCRRYREQFAGHGIDAGRLELLFTTPQPKTWEAYSGIDISLDPFPQNGGTTTIEALWFGIPSVSLRGRPSVGRMGASILGSVGLGDWIADSQEEYVAKAVAGAKDLEALAALRSTLRGRMAASPLCDGRGLASALERVYERLWQDYCDREQRIEALQASAATAYREGYSARAAELFSEAVKLAPRAEALSNLGAALRSAGRLDESESAYRQAIARNPACAPAHGNLGNLLLGRGRFADAEAALRRSIELAPNEAQVLRNLGTCLMRQGRLEQAQPYLERALELDSSDGDIYDNLAQLLRQRGQYGAAARLYEKARPLITNNWRAIGNVALLAMDFGRFDEAEGLFRRALALKPDYALAHANLLFCMNYHPSKTAEEIFAEYRRFDEAHARKHLPADLSFENERSPGRRLRVGFLSPDFREHSARHFLWPLLAHYDRERMEVFCYAQVARPDHVTREFQGLAGHWRSTVGHSDEEVAAMIRRDRIDVLMDCGGHTSESRILVMARKPAPVQVAYMLGHGYTSGLSAIDAFLADAALVPQGSEHLFSEKVVRLPRFPVAYTPPREMPDVGPLPALTKGHLTFGHFGRIVRVNEQVVSAWAKILKAVPRARLVLNTISFADEEARLRFRDSFARHGITADRLDLVFTSPQPKTWAAYGDIDIALDPFPHNAGTTTIEALWLGIPVVSLADRPSVGRFGASILREAGLSDWVANSVENYVSCAAAKAGDLEALARLRASLRARMEASPLCDGRGLAREIEAAFRNLWTEWCRGTPRAPAASLAPAVSAFHAGDFQRVLAEADRYIAMFPNDGEAHHLRGIARYRLDQLADAADDLTRSSQIMPARADVRWNLTAMLRGLGRLKEAEVQGREAVRLAPEAPEAHNNLGSVLKDMSRHTEAEALYRHAIALRPNYADAWSNLAWTLSLAGNLREAETAARHALGLNPRDAIALNNLGNALLQQDRLAEAADCFERAVAIKPDFAIAHSNLLFCLNYRTDLSGEQIFAAYRNWDAVHAAKLRPQRPIITNTKDPGRRLRIGYVSPDFRNHAVSFFVEQMIAAHDRTKFEITCYAEVANPDPVTERFKRHADRWRSTVGLTDSAVADLIRSDEIDVLVDLAGHTGGNRLLTFARKPAPVQVAHMIGSGTTTGMTAMDAFLADNLLAPPGAECFFSERVFRLSRLPQVYTPPERMPDVKPLPAARTGHVTFGCFSRTVRINETVVAAWARILKSVPSARLVLNSKPFREAESREAWLARFTAKGVAPHQVELVYTAPQPRTWEAYGQVDIALDPFPHNAGTTTIEALWMGVPVVSLAGRPPVGRFGASILGALGLEDWVTHNVEDYVGRALTAASDLSALAALRAELRARLKASPLGSDAPGLAREIEAVYRQLWREFCAETS